jgi:hypothetical protein
MRTIAVTVAFVFAVVALSPVPSADAAVNNARYIACRKKVAPQRSYGPAFLFAVDQCYRGLPW